MQMSFYKNHDDDVISWVENIDTIGEFLFTFDRKKIYNLFADYPHNMTDHEVEIFNEENPQWRKFFVDRNLRRMIEVYNRDKKDPSVAFLILYAVHDLDEAVKLMKRVIDEKREFVAISPGSAERPDQGMEHVGSIPNGELYIK